MFLQELLHRANLDDMGVLLIHGINPYGFKLKRRFTENNVDLNRNSSADKSLFSSANQGYGDLNHFLNPKTKVNLTSFDHFFFQLNAIARIVKHSMGTLRQAVLQGQYQYEKGIYFGGNTLEPSIKAVTPLIQKTAQEYDMVFNIDLHTGYGANGTLHLFPNPSAFPDIQGIIAFDYPRLTVLEKTEVVLMLKNDCLNWKSKIKNDFFVTQINWIRS